MPNAVLSADVVRFIAIGAPSSTLKISCPKSPTSDMKFSPKRTSTLVLFSTHVRMNVAGSVRPKRPGTSSNDGVDILSAFCVPTGGVTSSICHGPTSSRMAMHSMPTTPSPQVGISVSAERTAGPVRIQATVAKTFKYRIIIKPSHKK